MEYLPFGDLAKYITPEITEWDAQQVITELLDGLCIMHQNGFTHRDLKPQVRLSPNFCDLKILSKIMTANDLD
jgi:serine/threonine protein kinase